MQRGDGKRKSAVAINVIPHGRIQRSLYSNQSLKRSKLGRFRNPQLSEELLCLVGFNLQSPLCCRNKEEAQAEPQ